MPTLKGTGSKVLITREHAKTVLKADFPCSSKMEIFSTFHPPSMLTL